MENYLKHSVNREQGRLFCIFSIDVQYNIAKLELAYWGYLIRSRAQPFSTPGGKNEEGEMFISSHYSDYNKAPRHNILKYDNLNYSTINKSSN